MNRPFKEKPEPTSHPRRPAYTVFVRGKIPADLSEQISQAHSKALEQRDRTETEPKRSEVHAGTNNTLAAE